MARLLTPPDASVKILTHLKYQKSFPLPPTFPSFSLTLFTLKILPHLVFPHPSRLHWRG